MRGAVAAVAASIAAGWWRRWRRSSSAGGEVGSRGNLEASATLAMTLVERSRSDAILRRQCREEAERRLGRAGGGRRMAELISAMALPES